MKLINTTITTFIVAVMLILNIHPVQAANLEFSNISVKDLDNDKLTIQWTTNQPSQGWLQVGMEPGKYLWVTQANTFNTYQQATILLPKENTTYHYRVIAENLNGDRIMSFAFNYKVDKFVDTKAPEFISIPKTLYVDNTNAFLIWQTNEQTNAEIKYSLYSDLSQPKTARAGSDRNKNHQAKVNLSRLKPNTTYYYEIIITDTSKNTAKTAVLNFTTKSQADTEPLKLINQKPLANNDSFITASSIKSTWTTSRPAYCEFLYGEKNKYKKKLTEISYETWEHSFLAEDLKPGTEYQYRIYCRDIFGKKIETNDILFQTRTPLVLGYEFGDSGQKSFYGQTYQLVKAEGSTNVYALVKNQKYLIKSPSIFQAYGFSWSEVKTISTKELAKYPDVKLVKTPDGSAVYFLYHSYQRKKAILSENAFHSYRDNSFNKVVTISTNDLNTYTDMVLVKEQNKPTVYLLQNNIKRPIKNMTSLLNNNLGHQPIGIVSAKDLDSYQTGNILE
jgi:hypothetical protein